jgi:hypothetical protein
MDETQANKFLKLIETSPTALLSDGAMGTLLNARRGF